MTKKRSSEIFTLKMEIFPEIGPRKSFLVPPQIRRQVSAHAFNVLQTRAYSYEKAIYASVET